MVESDVVGSSGNIRVIFGEKKSGGRNKGGRKKRRGRETKVVVGRKAVDRRPGGTAGALGKGGTIKKGDKRRNNRRSPVIGGAIGENAERRNNRRSTTKGGVIGRDDRRGSDKG